MSEASNRAVLRAYDILRPRYSRKVRPGPRLTVEEVLAAAHDPALGLDRSVCLRDMVEALRGMELGSGSDGAMISSFEDFGPDEAADFIEREFT